MPTGDAVRSLRIARAGGIESSVPNPATMPTRLTCLLPAIAALVAAEPLTGQPAPQTPRLIPIETLFSAPEAADAALSPDGSAVAYLAPWRGRLNIHLRFLDGPARVRRITADTVRSIAAYWWSADGTRLLYLQDGGGDERYHLFVANPRTTAAARDLTPFPGVEVEVVALPAARPGTAVITLNRRTPTLADAYRVDLTTGALLAVAENPGTFLGYAADDSGRVLVAYSVDSGGRYALHARASERDAWRTVRSYPVEDRIVPLRVAPDGRSVVMLSTAGSDLARVVRADLQAGAEAMLDEDPLRTADAEPPLLTHAGDAVLVAAYDSDTLRLYGRTEAARTMLQLATAQIRGGGLSVAGASADQRRWLLVQSAPDVPTRTWLLDGRTRRVTLLHRYRPSLDRFALARMRPVAFPARDGLPLRGYVTEPAGRGARRVPLVLLVHGGPWARDRHDFQGEVQLLANRGYAVLQVNYRGSTGFGKRFARAARREFAGRMHEDLLDGVRWAVDAGIADSTRVAIMGGSYGGYAALVGLTFTPRTFRCAVDYAGMSNLVTLLESFPPSWQPFLPRNWYPFVGDPRDSASRADLIARSPLFRVDAAVAPLLIFQGANDPRVTPEQSGRIAGALHRRRIPVTYLLAAAEGHDFSEAETALAVNRAAELFLARCLGGRAQPRTIPSIARALRRMRVDLDSLVRHP
ncbi:MAG: S9 family peptidase [Gemmatimonadaceae bacterium]|nr:S9 family peptidase [Gemmatimonadaceae bacterium]